MAVTDVTYEGTSAWRDTVPLIEWGEPTTGLMTDSSGVMTEGVMNTQAKVLADRTKWLYDRQAFIGRQLATVLIDSRVNDYSPSIRYQLKHIKDTKEAIADVLADLGAPTTGKYFREYPDCILSLDTSGRDVTNVANLNWFNATAHVGGISWVNPVVDYRAIQIVDLDTDTVVGEVAKGDVPNNVFYPQAGTHHYRIQTAFNPGAGSTSAPPPSTGVTLPVTTYSERTDAFLVKAEIPRENPHLLVLTFDNAVRYDTSQPSPLGLSVGGFGDKASFTDTLVFRDQPDVFTVRLALQNECFVRGGGYTVSYDDSVAGAVLKRTDGSGSPISGWSRYGLFNRSTAVGVGFVSAQVPRNEPGTLVVVMTAPVDSVDASKFSLFGSASPVSLSLVSPMGQDSSVTVQFSVTPDILQSDAGMRLTMTAGGCSAGGAVVDPFTAVPVRNALAMAATVPVKALVPAAGSDTLVLVMNAAVSIGGVSSGTGCPQGFSLLAAGITAITGWSVSDGTVVFSVAPAPDPTALPVLVYDGSNAQFTDAQGAVPRFSIPVINNRVDNFTGYFGSRTWGGSTLWG